MHSSSVISNDVFVLKGVVNPSLEPGEMTRDIYLHKRSYQKKKETNIWHSSHVDITMCLEINVQRSTFN